MKKILLTFFCVSICAATLCGCSDDNPSSQNETVLQKDVTESTTPVETDAPFVPDDSYKYEYKDGTIYCYDADGKMLIHMTLDIPLDNTVSGEVLCDDYNFDGYTDISLMYSKGVQNSYYYFWMYDKSHNYYLKYDRLTNVPSPVFDKKNETVTSFDHISATDNAEYLYYWSDGQLKLSTRKVQEAVDSGLRFTTYIIDEAGNESIQKTFTIGNDAAAEKDDVIAKTTEVAKIQFNVHNTDFSVDYLGTEEVNGIMRHKISFAQNFDVVATLYPAVGNFSDMLADKNDGNGAKYAIDVTKTPDETTSVTTTAE